MTRVSVTTPREREIVAECVLDAPRDRIWEAFTDPELIPEWWGLRDDTTIIEELDIRPGGTWRVIQRAPDGGESALTGTYREVAPPERMVHTFEWEPGRVLVETAELEDLGERTKVTITSLFDTTEERDEMLDSGMERGLNEAYEQLDELLGGTAPTRPR